MIISTVPIGILTTTATTYIIRSQLDDTHFREVVVTGQNLTYDLETLTLSGGTVSAMSVVDSVLHNGKANALTYSTYSNINLPAMDLAGATPFGTALWNSVNNVVASLSEISVAHSNVLFNTYARGSATGTGTEAADQFTGSRFADILNGLGGDDVIVGGRGHDTINGGDGNDRLIGNAGHDDLVDLSGSNTLIGGAGNDFLHGGVGDDILNGGVGRDLFYGFRGNDQVTGGRGADTFVFDRMMHGSLVITDFKAEDVLVDMGSSDVPTLFAAFQTGAVQNGSDVVYTDALTTVILKNVNITAITEANFASFQTALDAGFFYAV